MSTSQPKQDRRSITQRRIGNIQVSTLAGLLCEQLHLSLDPEYDQEITMDVEDDGTLTFYVVTGASKWEEVDE